MASTILVIEDDAAIRDGVTVGLTGAGYGVRCAATWAEGRRLIITPDINAVLLDLVLPGGDGLTLLTHLRQHHPQRPVLIMTARGAIDDRVTGLGAGADDYIVKPFGLAELLARVSAVLRRCPSRLAPAAGRLEFSGGWIDFAKRQAKIGDTDYGLTEQEADLLKILAERRDRAVPRGELMALLWHSEGSDLSSRAVDMAVLRLREKLGDPINNPRIIATVRGVGYRLADPVRVL